MWCLFSRTLWRLRRNSFNFTLIGCNNMVHWKCIFWLTLHIRQKQHVQLTQMQCDRHCIGATTSLICLPLLLNPVSFIPFPNYFVFLLPLNPVRRSEEVWQNPHSAQWKKRYPATSWRRPNTLSIPSIYKVGRDASHGSHMVVAPMATGLTLRVQVTVGSGRPLAWQSSVKFSFRSAVTSAPGNTSTLGGPTHHIHMDK